MMGRVERDQGFGERSFRIMWEEERESTWPNYQDTRHEKEQ